MRLPESRFQSTSRARMPAILVVLSVLGIGSVITAVALLFFRSQIPLFALWDVKPERSALDLWKDGAYEEVVETLDPELDIHPMDAEALALRGFAHFYLAMQQVDTELQQVLIVQSIRDLRRALLAGETPLLPEVHFVLGKAYYHRGAYFYDSAISELHEALDMGLESVEILEYLGVTYRELGDVEQARTYLTAAAKQSGEYIHYLALADLERDAELFDDAASVYQLVIDGAEDGIIVQRALQGLAFTQRKRGLYDEAMATYHHLLEENPSSAEAHFGMGEVYLETEQTDLARFEWREALRLDPNHIESLERLQEY